MMDGRRSCLRFEHTMIPTEEQAKALWRKYQLPESKRRHVELVGRVSRFLAEQLTRNNQQLTIHMPLLTAAALLHDIDKNARKLPGERHPDAAVRILKEEGMDEVAALVATHPLHAILDPAIAPTRWEEKILFLADKMVKYDIISVDERFRLWNEEMLLPEGRKILSRAYPKVKELEKELLGFIGVTPAQVAQLV